MKKWKMEARIEKLERQLAWSRAATKSLHEEVKRLRAQLNMPPYIREDEDHDQR